MVQKLSLNMIPAELKFQYLLLHKEINKIRIELEDFEPKTKEHNEWIKEKLQIYSKLYVQIQCINDKILKRQKIKISKNI